METNNKFLWIDWDPALYSTNYMGLFDLTKGILMVVIILSHCFHRYIDILFYPSDISKLEVLLLGPLAVISYGTVSMLFMVCGYGIRRQSVKKYAKNQLSLFLFPYLCVIVCLIITALVKWCVAGGSLTNRLAHQVLPFLFGFHPGAHLLGESAVQIGPVWFFFTYIFASIYLNLILQEPRVWVQVLLLALSTAAGCLLIGLPLPFCIQQVLICSGFLYAGMQLKRWKIPQQKIPWFAFFLILCLCTLSRGLGGLAEIANNLYVFGAMELITVYLAGVMMLCLMLRLNALQGILPDSLRWVGRHMMWFCCVHTVSEKAMPWGRIKQFFAGSPMTGLLLEILFSLVFAVLGCRLLNGCVKKILSHRRARRAG